MADKIKDPAAVALGQKGGKQRAKNLSAQELSRQGRKAARARWKKKGAGEENRRDSK